MIPTYLNTNIEDLPNENWVDVYGYDGIYEVSNLGRVKSLERYVSNGRGGERIVKERILKQPFIGKEKKRVSVGFCVNNINIKQEVSTVVFYSFNPELLSDNEGKEVCHINKNALDNRLENLKLMPIKESKNMMFELRPEIKVKMKKHGEKRKKDTDNIKNRKCSNCGLKQDIQYFRRGSRKCKKCESKLKYENKLKREGKKRKNNKKVYIKDTVTNEITVSSNKNKCIVSGKIIDRYANTGKLLFPSNCSRHTNPLLIEYRTPKN